MENVMTWQIDPAHSEIGFRTKHMMIATVKGKFTEFEGEFNVNEDDLSKSAGTIRIKAASIDTGVEQRDNHLRSGDFFDAETTPFIVFATTAIQLDGHAATITGNLTIRDVTRPVTFKGDLGGPLKDPWGNAKIVLSAETQINRKDWGLNWNQALEAGGLLVSDRVTLHVDLELAKAA